MSTSHLILLFLILLILFGPSRLEGIGLSLGKAVKGFKKGMEEETATPEQKQQKNDTPPPTAQA